MLGGKISSCVNAELNLTAILFLNFFQDNLNSVVYVALK